MGKMNKHPGKRWQELLGLTVVPFFEQDTFSYNDNEGDDFVFDPDTMSLINPIDIEAGLYNTHAFEAGLYTEMYDENDTFLGYAYVNDDFAYLDTFLDDGKYDIVEGKVSINKEEQRITAQSRARFISAEFTEATEYELLFTYETNSPEYRNVILYGYDENIENGYSLGIDIPQHGFGLETFVDGEKTDFQQYKDIKFGPGVYEIKIIRDGSDAEFYVDGELIGTADNVERNTLGLWKWGGGSNNISNIFINENASTPTSEPVTASVDISVSVTDGKDPVESASVTLSTPDEKTIVASSTTGKLGGCTLKSVAPGEYKVKAQAQGYNDYESSENFVVTKDTTTLSITLTKTE